jgi:very-short-patch-repair endonuclease
MSFPDQFKRQLFELAESNADQTHAYFVKVCESPIECLFATAFVMLGSHNYGSVAAFTDGHPTSDLHGYFEWFIIPQRAIGAYRADFVVGALPEREDVRIIVECDGHNFHERTPAQAERDRRRDREMLSSGHKVFRFTGREIYRDAFDCATEVFEHLLVMLTDEGMRK